MHFLTLCVLASLSAGLHLQHQLNHQLNGCVQKLHQSQAHRLPHLLLAQMLRLLQPQSQRKKESKVLIRSDASQRLNEEPLTPLAKGRDMAFKLLKKKSDAANLALSLQNVPYAEQLAKEMNGFTKEFESVSCMLGSAFCEVCAI